MLEFDTDLTWLTFIDSLDITGSSIKHGLSSLRIGVLQALGQKHESTDNTDDKSLNTLKRLDSSNSYEWYVKESTFSDSQWQHIQEIFENCWTLILLEMSSMHSEWYHNLQLSQHTALWWSQVTGNSQQPQGYIDIGPVFTCISPDKIIMRSVRVFDDLDLIKVIIKKLLYSIGRINTSNTIVRDDTTVVRLTKSAFSMIGAFSWRELQSGWIWGNKSGGRLPCAKYNWLMFCSYSTLILLMTIYVTSKCQHFMMIFNSTVDKNDFFMLYDFFLFSSTDVIALCKTWCT